jgi:hypothetical protein
MSAGQLNILIESGATFARTIAVKDAGNAAVDLSSVVGVTGQLRTRIQDDTSNGEFTCSIQVPATGGIIDWGMTSAETTALEPGKQYYDIELEYDNGVVIRLLEGEAQIKGNITRV